MFCSLFDLHSMVERGEAGSTADEEGEYVAGAALWGAAFSASITQLAQSAGGGLGFYAKISTRGRVVRPARGAPALRAERVDRIQEHGRSLRDQRARRADGREDHVGVRVRLEVPGGDLPLDRRSEPLFDERGRLLGL